MRMSGSNRRTVLGCANRRLTNNERAYQRSLGLGAMWAAQDLVTHWYRTGHISGPIRIAFPCI